MSRKNSECEDEWYEIQQRFEKEGLDYVTLCSEERLLHVWRWLVDAESNLRSSRRQLDKLRDLRSEEMEEMESYIGHIRDLAEKRADHLESETLSLRSKLESSQQQTATLATLLEKSGLHCIADESLGEQMDVPIPAPAECEVRSVIKFLNAQGIASIEIDRQLCQVYGQAVEEQRLRVFENKVLRKIFGARRDEITGEWRKLHNAELHALYSSPGIIRNIKSRRLRWAGHVAHMGESRNAYRVLVGRPERKRHLERPRRRWEDNIKMVLREVGYDDRDWINLAQDRDRWRAYVSSEKEVLRREVAEMCDRVQLLEKASRQLELDNERLAFKDNGETAEASGGQSRK
ncbi:hypothetical protein ANN_20099 [Periplaneta americana]|uniref:Uncharacterized protein n=1 Tax=Periplaneta americana TaxID=6978 RepID=A0ABQ8SBP9_PERAM|nr:hypothetical protein ANN_20099 [Periplaneta americana]